MNTKITEYSIETILHPSNCETINNKIKQGWQPYGPFASHGNYGYQVMVKYEEVKIPKKTLGVQDL